MLITAQSHAITYIVNIRLCTPTKHEYTEVNTCVVCGVLAEQTVYSRYFSKKPLLCTQNITNSLFHLPFLPHGCLQKQKLAGKFMTF